MLILGPLNRAHANSKMPCEYTIHTGQGVLCVKATGVLTDEELRVVSSKAFNDPQFHPALNAFLDYSMVTDWQVSGATCSNLARSRKFAENTKTAIVAVGPVGYGLGRVYEAWIERGKVKLFLDKAEAIAWLNEEVLPEKVFTC